MIKVINVNSMFYFMQDKKDIIVGWNSYKAPHCFKHYDENHVRDK